MNHSSTSAPAGDRTRMSFQLADGRIFSYAKYGKPGGIPFIMHHGSPGSRIETERAVYHELGIEMIYPERPGYGNASPNAKASFASWAKDMMAFLEHLGIDRVHVGGISAGGAYTLACAAYYPERFQSATLIASVAPPQAPQYKKGMALANRLGFWMNKYAPFLVRMSSRNFATGFKRDPEYVWNQIAKQLCLADLLIIEKAKESGLFQVYIDHLLEAFKNGVEGHLADMRNIASKWEIPFQNIQCPIYLWHGEADTLSPIAGAKAFEKWLPNIQAHYFPDQGHLIAEEEIYLKLILEEIHKGK